ncbi:MAG TPA: rhodanese-like domain-containing protein, partial [Actinomycetota bacterium]|nr:rhodanese-like domain-containing protein [Actinomycetota bacterium]
LDKAVLQLFRIGFERVLGHLEGGVEAWRASGREIASYPLVGVDELARSAAEDPERIMDVRQRDEWEAGHLPGTRHLFVGDLPGRLGELPTDVPLTVACASGYRASMAASLLARAGNPVRLVAEGGVPDALGPRAGA